MIGIVCIFSVFMLTNTLAPHAATLAGQPSATISTSQRLTFIEKIVPRTQGDRDFNEAPTSPAVNPSNLAKPTSTPSPTNPTASTSGGTPSGTPNGNNPSTPNGNNAGNATDSNPIAALTESSNSGAFGLSGLMIGLLAIIALLIVVITVVILRQRGRRD